MRRERSRAAAEGEQAGRGWKMAAGSVDQCFPDWAYGHTSYSLPSVALPGPLACPAQQWAIKAMQKGHSHPVVDHP